MKGGKLAWRHVIDDAIHLQSLNAQGQASLLIGADHVMRVKPPQALEGIVLDDWRRSVTDLVPAAVSVVDLLGDAIAHRFLTRPASPYTPFFRMADGE